MGLYDRDYLQDNYQPRWTGGGTRMMVTNLVILNAGVFLLNAFLGRDASDGSWPLLQWFAARPEHLVQPWMWWRMLTSGFVHDPTGISHVFWNMFGLFIFGRDVEWRYGRQELLWVYLVAIVSGSFIWCLRNHLQDASQSQLIGASGGVTAIILLFVYNFPHRTILLMFVFPVPAWVLGVLIIAGNATGVLGMSGDARTAFDVHLVGAAFATAYFFGGWNLTRWSWGLGRRPGGGSRRGWPRWRKKSALRLHDPQDEQPDREEAEADRILAKVSREGLDSITSKERRKLEAYSRRVRQRRGE